MHYKPIALIESITCSLSAASVSNLMYADFEINTAFDSHQSVANASAPIVR